MKNKGFTLIELLGVMIVLTLLAFLVSEIIINNIKNTNEDLEKVAVDIIQSSAREYVDSNTDEYPKVMKKVYCITYQQLETAGHINDDILPKISNIDAFKAKYIQAIYNGNLFEYDVVDTCNPSDSTKPTLVVNPSSEKYKKNGNVTITVSDNEGGSGLASTNVYKYCLSTSSTTRENCEWTTYTSGTSFDISGANQTKYLWVWPIKDNVENINGDHTNVNTPYVAGIYKFASNYTITYNCNGGEGSTTSSTHTYGVAKPLSNNGCYKLTEGTSGMVYQFVGWSTSSTATSPIYTDGQSVSDIEADDTVTLYAVWNDLFSYTGDKNVIDDGNGNWRIKFLTSGTLTANVSTIIDAFLVGGGGGGSTSGGYNGLGGGGGGYTKTQPAVSLSKNTDYIITVGAGGARNGNGGNSSAFDVTANGGKGATSASGGAGGSGGGGGAGNDYNHGTGTGGRGGTNGGNGVGGGDTGYAGSGGTGQGTTTREFSETSGTLYSGGGGGVGKSSNGAGGDGGGARGGTSATANTGGGGGGNGTGGSGIVVIRNKR